MNKTTRLLIIIITIVVITAVVVYIVQKGEEPAEEEGLGSSLYKQIEGQKEAMEIPETNPFKAETNPLQGVKTNPFEE